MVAFSVLLYFLIAIAYSLVSIFWFAFRLGRFRLRLLIAIRLEAFYFLLLSDKTI